MTGQKNIDIQPIDFEALIDDLRWRGFSVQEIADAVGTSQPNITRINYGVVGEPRYQLGARLVELHKQAMRKKKQRKK